MFSRLACDSFHFSQSFALGKKGFFRGNAYSCTPYYCLCHAESAQQCACTPVCLVSFFWCRRLCGLFCNRARLSHIQVGELLSGSTTVLVTIKPGTGMNTGKLEALFSLRCSASLAELMNSNKEIPV